MWHTHGIFRRYTVTPANIHDSQILPMLLDPENTDDYAWADSAYAGECFEDVLNHEALKVAFTKRATALTRLATQPKSATVLNQQ